jgi:hypothetical protein
VGFESEVFRSHIVYNVDFELLTSTNTCRLYQVFLSFLKDVHYCNTNIFLATLVLMKLEKILKIRSVLANYYFCIVIIVIFILLY